MPLLAKMVHSTTGKSMELVERVSSQDGATMESGKTGGIVPPDSAWLKGGLTLGLVFAWMLSLPFYGPLSVPILASSASRVGHTFVVSHAVAYFLIPSLLPSLRRRIVFIASPVLSGTLTAVAGVLMVLSGSPQWQLVSAIIGGIGAATLVLNWAEGFITRSESCLELGFAMASCNLFLAFFPWMLSARPGIAKPVAVLLAMFPLCASLLVSRNRKAQISTSTYSKGPLWLLLAFALVEYFSGGLWYRVVIPAFYAAWPRLGGLETVIYALEVAALSVWVRHRGYTSLGIASVSLSGLGLLWFLVGSGNAAGLIATLLLALGLGSMDLFFWLCLREVAARSKSVALFGSGLGASVLFIALPGLAFDLRLTSGSANDPVTMVAGASLLFIAIPLVLKLNQSVGEGKTDSTGAPASAASTISIDSTPPTYAFPCNPAAPPPPPFLSKLSPQELRVYEFLRRAKTDKQIASELLISPDTVKYHTRRILRKAGVANRKELLAASLSDPSFDTSRDEVAVPKKPC